MHLYDGNAYRRLMLNECHNVEAMKKKIDWIKNLFSASIQFDQFLYFVAIQNLLATIFAQLLDASKIRALLL